MFGLTEINADIINTGSLNVLTTIQAPTVKTNLVQSINPTNNLTLEALTTGQVIIRSNGANIAVFDTANNLITFNARVSQTRTDNAVSFGPGACLAPTGTTQQLSAFGAGALQFIQGGNFNSAFGSNALRNVSSGGNNVGFGADAGRNITSGGGNMCIGLQANFNTTSGGDNCSVGTQAGSGYNTGGSNVCIGTRSGVISTSFNGSNNTSIGTESGQASATMNAVTSIGRRANFGNTVSCSNSTAIGTFAGNTTSNQIQLGYGGQFTSTDNMSVGKTSFPTTKFDVEGSSLFNGIVSVRNGNNLQIFNNANTQQTNEFMLNNDYFVNNTSSIGSIQLRINGNTRLNLTDTNIDLNSLATFNSSTNTITLNRKVYQNLQDTLTSNCSFGNLSGSVLSSTSFGNSLFGQNSGQNINGNGTGGVGCNNTCVGYNSGQGLTSGQQNVFLGSECSKVATNAIGNVICGHLAGTNLSSGQYNVCLGFQSSQSITSGVDNISLGLFSGVQNNTGSQGALQRNISIGRETGNALNGSENITLGWRSNYLVSGLLSSFTNSVCIGNSLNNTLSNQILIGSGSQWLTTPKISVNKLTSPVQTVDIVGTLDVTGNITTPTRPAGTNDTSVATTAFVQTAVSSVTTQTPTTSKYLFDECWDSAYNQCPIGGYNWTWQGTGGNSFVYGDANHPGQYGMSANKAIMSDLFYHYPLQEITFIAKTENTTNTGDIYMGLCVSYGSYGRSAMIRKTTATNTFSAVTNNVNKGNFSTVTWTTNVWYEFKITFNNPDISYKITNLTSNATETITDTTAVFDFTNQTMLFFQIGSGGGTNTADLDFVSVSYVVPSRA
jgi:hypothetical protein